MVKKLLYICFISICMFSFYGSFSADTPVDMICKYKNPFGSDTFTVVFTNYTNKYYSASDGKIRNGAYIKAEGSTFGNIYVGKYSKYGETEFDFSITTEHAMLYSGRRFVFGSVGDKDIITNLDSFGKPSGTYTCPSLSYSIYNGKLKPEQGVVVLHFSNDEYCSSHKCTSIKLTENIIYDPNKPDREIVSQCPFEVRSANTTDKLNLIFNSYSDGTIFVTFQGKPYQIDMNNDLPVRLSYTSGSDFSSDNLKFVQITKSNLRNIINVGSGNKLSCVNALVSCYTDSTYHLAYSESGLPDNKMCRKHSSNVEIDDPTNADVSENPDVTLPSVNPDLGVCSTYLGLASNSESVAYWLDRVYTIIKIGSIVGTIVWSMLDLAKVIANNKDLLMETVKKCAIRLIVLVVILLLPAIIDLFGNLIGIPDILCGIK